MMTGSHWGMIAETGKETYDTGHNEMWHNLGKGAAMTTDQKTGPTTTVLHPAAEGTIASHKLAPRPSGLKGATVGLIDNHKRNADVFLEELAGLLMEKFGVARVINYKKDSQSIPAPEKVLDDLASQCQAIIHAVAD